jgi:hypothetical protein
VATYQIETDQGTYQIETDEPQAQNTGILSNLGTGIYEGAANLPSSALELLKSPYTVPKAIINNPASQTLDQTGRLAAAASGAIVGGAAGSFLPVVGNLIGSAIGGGIGYFGYDKANQFLGNEAPTTAAEDARTFGQNLSTGAGLGVAGKTIGVGGKVLSKAGGLADTIFPPEAADSASLQDPQVQKALQFADREGFLNKPADEITSIGQGTKQAIDVVQRRAGDLADNISAQLGADAGDTAVEKAFSEQFKKAAPTLIKSGIFEKSADVPELLDNAQTRLQEINTLRDQGAKILDQQVLNFNQPTTPINQMVGVMSAQTPEIATAVKELTERMERLNYNELSQPIADGIKTTTESILRDIKPTPGPNGTTPILGPGRAIQMMQNLNEVRRNLLREFDTATISARISGNTPSNLSSISASIEAISKLQRALSNGLESSVADLSRVSGINLDPTLFSKLNDEYGALKSLEDMGDKFTRGTAKGRAVRDPTRIVQNAGQEQVIPSVFSPHKAAAGYVENLASKMQDLPNDAVKRAFAVENRNAFALKNIHDLIDLNKNPLNLLPTKATSAGAKIQTFGDVLSTFGHSGVLPGLGVANSQSKDKRQPGPGVSKSFLKNSIASVFSPSKPLSLIDDAMADVPPEVKTVPPALLSKIKKVESGSKGSEATSPVGAKGSFQLMDALGKEYHKRLDIKEPYNPRNDKQAEKIASAFLSDLMDKYDDPELAIAAYNLGEPKLDKLLKATGAKTFEEVQFYLPKETREYVPKVLKA